MNQKSNISNEQDDARDSPSQPAENQADSKSLITETSNFSQYQTDKDTMVRMGSDLAPKMFKHSEICSPDKSISSELSLLGGAPSNQALAQLDDLDLEGNSNTMCN